MSLALRKLVSLLIGFDMCDRHLLVSRDAIYSRRLSATSVAEGDSIPITHTGATHVLVKLPCEIATIQVDAHKLV